MSENDIDIDKKLRDYRSKFLYCYSRKEEYLETYKLPLKDFFIALRNKVEQYKEDNFQQLRTLNKNAQKRKRIYVAHYTSIETVSSILRDVIVLKKEQTKIKPNGLRLYAASEMNDPTEGDFLKKRLLDMCPWVQQADRTDAFVCSFVSSKNLEEAVDNVTYWQTYGEDGFGCSILPSDAIPDLFPVKYKDNEIKKMKKFFKQSFGYCNKMYKKLKPSERSEFANDFWKCFDPIKFLYKHSGYEKENEYRCIKYADANSVVYDVNGLSSSSTLRSYITTPGLMTKNILATESEIYIGPRVRNPQTVRKYFEQLAHDAGLVEVKFYCSEVPYRGGVRKK